MANKKSEDKLAGAVMILCVIAVIVVLLLSVAAILTPIVVLILFLVNIIKYKKNDSGWRASGFWLTPYEKRDFKQACVEIYAAVQSRNEVQEAIRREGISINQNGQISARSYRGKALREQLNSANYTLDEAQAEFNRLSNAPRLRYKNARKHYSKAVGFGVAAALWAIVLIPFAFNAGGLRDDIISDGKLDSKLIAVEQQIPQTEPETTDTTDGNDTGETSTIGALMDFGTGLALPIIIGTLSVVFVMWLIGLIIFVCKNRKPPVVSWENVDTYQIEPPKKRQKEENQTHESEREEEVTAKPQNDKNEEREISNTIGQNGWTAKFPPKESDEICITNDHGNPGIIKVEQIDGHYCISAAYENDNDFAEPLKTEKGGNCSGGKWWQPVPEPYCSRISSGQLHESFKNDKDFQDYVITNATWLQDILSRHHRTSVWKAELGNHAGWKIFIWQWDILACELSMRPERPYLDTFFDASYGKIIIRFANRKKDLTLLKSTLERINCGEIIINKDGHAILEEISMDNADSVPAKIKAWIEKING